MDKLLRNGFKIREDVQHQEFYGIKNLVYAQIIFNIYFALLYLIGCFVTFQILTYNWVFTMWRIFITLALIIGIGMWLIEKDERKKVVQRVMTNLWV